jgi:hypothetical protein
VGRQTASAASAIAGSARLVAEMMAIQEAMILMSVDEAKECIRRIRNNLESIRYDLLTLHEREGWKALGYSNWRECATNEFGSSQAQVYRLLSEGRTEQAIGVPIGSTPGSHLRELATLDTTEEQKQALARADELAAGDRRTAGHVQAAVAEVRQVQSKQESVQLSIPTPAPRRTDATIMAEIRAILTMASAHEPRSDGRLSILERAMLLTSEVMNGDAFRSISAEVVKIRDEAPNSLPAPAGWEWERNTSRNAWRLVSEIGATRWYVYQDEAITAACNLLKEAAALEAAPNSLPALAGWEWERNLKGEWRLVSDIGTTRWYFYQDGAITAVQHLVYAAALAEASAQAAAAPVDSAASLFQDMLEIAHLSDASASDIVKAALALALYKLNSKNLAAQRVPLQLGAEACHTDGRLAAAEFLEIAVQACSLLA